MTGNRLVQRTATTAGLAVRDWYGDGPAVLALAGLTSSGAAWSTLARALPEWRLVAPDLRGRGGSPVGLGPVGLRAHAGDVSALIDELDLHDVVVVGHSMGAYLALLVAQERPDRVRRLVLVDGGIRPDLPFFVGPALTRLALRRQLGKLDREWPDVETLARVIGIDKVLASRPELRPVVLEMLEAELTGPPGALRGQVDVPRAIADAIDTFHGGDAEAALAALTVPTHLLLATHGRGDDKPPLISDKALATWTARLPGLSAERLPANHVTLQFDAAVARAVRGDCPEREGGHG